jgi:hypothetical protein
MASRSNSRTNNPPANLNTNNRSQTMKRHRKDPGLQVGDKLRFVYVYNAENGLASGEPYKHAFTVTKVTSRTFHTQYVKDTFKISTMDPFLYYEFRKEGDCWYAKIFVGRNPFVPKS